MWYSSNSLIVDTMTILFFHVYLSAGRHVTPCHLPGGMLFFADFHFELSQQQP